MMDVQKTGLEGMYNCFEIVSNTSDLYMKMTGIMHDFLPRSSHPVQTKMTVLLRFGYSPSHHQNSFLA
jgi:hypothetical protein